MKGTWLPPMMSLLESSSCTSPLWSQFSSLCNRTGGSTHRESCVDYVRKHRPSIQEMLISFLLSGAPFREVLSEARSCLVLPRAEGSIPKWPLCSSSFCEKCEGWDWGNRQSAVPFSVTVSKWKAKTERENKTAERRQSWKRLAQPYAKWNHCITPIWGSFCPAARCFKAQSPPVTCCGDVIWMQVWVCV